MCKSNVSGRYIHGEDDDTPWIQIVSEAVFGILNYGKCMCGEYRGFLFSHECHIYILLYPL